MIMELFVRPKDIEHEVGPYLLCSPKCVVKFSNEYHKYSYYDEHKFRSKIRILKIPADAKCDECNRPLGDTDES